MLELPGVFVSDGVSADLVRAGEPRLWGRGAARRRVAAASTVLARPQVARRRVLRPVTG